MSSFDLGVFQQQIAQQNTALPPIENWKPDFCGDIDMCIKHDGSWFYMGTPIGRMALVKLFASVLKREEDSYFLVTPVEKIGITVDDVPFLITQWQMEDGKLALTTNLDDNLVVSEENPIVLHSDKTSGAVLPYALVRRNLWARLHQNVFYQLAELGTESTLAGENHLCLQSGDYTFSLGCLDSH